MGDVLRWPYVDLPKMKDILDKYAWHIHQTLATVENAKEQKKLLGDLFRKVREIYRARGKSFDAWCKSGELGLSKAQIYRIMSGTTSGNRKTSPAGNAAREMNRWSPGRKPVYPNETQSG
jgi:hypothetical protein